MSEPNSASSEPASQVRPVKRRWWWWKAAFPLGLIFAVAAVAAMNFLYQPQYEASTLLEISEFPPYIAFEHKESETPNAYFRTQVEIIRSKWILERAIASPQVKDLPEIRKQPDAIEWLKKMVHVDSPGDSSIFEIKFNSADAESAASVVNEITRQYLTAQEQEDSSRFNSILSALNQQLTSREENVRTLRQQVEIASKIMPDEPDQGRGPSESKPLGKNPLAELQARLIDVQVERAMLSAQIKAREEDMRVAQVVAPAKGDNAAKKEARKSSSPKQDSIGGEAATLGARQDELRRLKVELRSCEIAEENLRSAYAAQVSKNLKDREELSGESLNLKFKKDELAEAQAVMARISDRLIALQTERSAPTRVMWHEPAIIPLEPVEEHLYRKMAVAGAAGFCFPYVAGFIALVLWNLGLLIGKLEPVPPEVTSSSAPSTTTDPKSGS